MPPIDPNPPQKSIEEVVEELGVYPIEAFDFVSKGLAFTCRRIHG